MANLELLISKINKISQELGGGADVNKASDPFVDMKLRIYEVFHRIEASQNHREKLMEIQHSESEQVIRIKYEIQSALKDAQNFIQQLYDVLQKQKNQAKKYSSIDIEAKETAYAGIVDKLNYLREMEKLSPEQALVYKQMRRNEPVLISSANMGGNYRRGELHDDEKQWKQQVDVNDQRIDEIAGQIYNNLDELGNRLQAFGDRMDIQMEKLDKLDQNIDDNLDTLETSTKKMRQILAKVREGDKFCVTLCLLLILIGLLTVAYNMLAAQCFIYSQQQNGG